MKKINKLFMLLITLLVMAPSVAFAQDKVNIYVFYGKECPHCANEKEFLTELKKEYDIEVFYYETWYDSKNQNLTLDVKAVFNDSDYSVPYTVIGNETFAGYSSAMDNDFIDAIKDYKGDNAQVVELVKGGNAYDFAKANTTSLIFMGGFLVVMVAGFYFVFIKGEKKNGKK